MSTENAPFDYIECINLIKQLFPKSYDDGITQQNSVRQRLTQWATKAFQASTLKNGEYNINNKLKSTLTFKDILHIISEENNNSNKKFYNVNNKKEAIEHKKNLSKLLDIVTRYYCNSNNQRDSLSPQISSEDLMYSTSPKVNNQNQQNQQNQQNDKSSATKTDHTDTVQQKNTPEKTPKFEVDNLLIIEEEQLNTDNKTVLPYENKNIEMSSNHTEKPPTESHPVNLMRKSFQSKEHNSNIRKTIFDEDDEIDLLLHRLFIE